MASNQQVLLTISARVDSALANIQRVESEVNSLAALVRSSTPLAFKVDVSAAVRELSLFRSQVDQIRRLTEDGIKITNIRFDLPGVEAQISRLVAAVEAGAAKSKAALEKIGSTKTKLGLADKAIEEAKTFEAEFKKIEGAFNRSVLALNTASRRIDFDPASKSAQRLRDNVRLAAEDAVAFLLKIPPAAQADAAAFDHLRTRIEALRVEAEKLKVIQVVSPKVAPAANAASGSMANLASAFKAAGAAAAAFIAAQVVSHLKDFALAAVQASGAMESLRLRFEAFFGGVQGGADTLDFLRTIADRVGVSFLDLASGFTRFAIAAESAGFQAREVREFYEALTISARGLGQSTDETNRTIDAFAQILQKGKVQSEELVKQLSNAGIPAVALLAKGLGVTTAKLREMLDGGVIPAKTAVQALAAEMLKTAGPSAQNQVSSYAAETARLANVWLEVKTAVGDRALPAVTGLLRELQKTGRDGRSALEHIGQGLSYLVTQAQDVARVLGPAITGQFEIVAKQLRAFLTEEIAGTIEFVDQVGSLVLDLFGIAERNFDVTPFVQRLRDSARDIRREIERESEAAAGAVNESQESIGERSQKLREQLIKDAAAAAAEQERQAKELTKKEQKELDKRREAFAEFFKAIAAGAAGEDGSKPSKKDNGQDQATKKAVDGLQKLRDELAATLAAKRALELQGSVSPEEIARLEELRQKVFDLEAQIRGYGSSAASAGEQAAGGFDRSGEAAGRAQQAAVSLGTSMADQLGERVTAALDKAINGSEAFAKAFESLPADVQQQVIAIIAEIERLAQSGQLTEAAFRVSMGELAKALSQGSADAQQFAGLFGGAMDAAAGKAASLADRLRDIAAATPPTKAEAESLSASLSGLAGKTGEASGGIIKLSGASDDAAIKIKGAGEAASEAGGGIIKLSGAADETAIKIKGAGEASKEAADKAKELGGATESVQPIPGHVPESITATGEAAATAAPSLKEAADAAEKIGKTEIKPDAAKSLADLGAAATSASGPLQAAATPADALAAAIAKIAEGASKLSGESGFSTIAKGLTELAPVVSQVLEPLKAVGEEVGSLGPSSVQFAAALGLIASRLSEVSSLLSGGGVGEGLQALADAGTAASPQIDTAATSVKGLADAVQAAQAALPEVATALGDLGKAAAAEDLATSLDKIGETLSDLGTAFTDSADTLERGATALGEIGKQAGPAAEGITKLGQAIGSEKLKSGSATLKDVGERSAAAAKGLSELTTAGDQANDQLKELGTTGRSAADALKGVGASAGQTAPKLRADLVPAVRILNDELETSRGHTEAIQAAINDLGSRGLKIVQALTVEVKKLADALGQAKANADQAAAALGNIRLPQVAEG